MKNNATGISVLIVDDDVLIRDCMTAYFEDEGFQVHGVSSGEKALRLIAELRPTVCISDLRLPGMSGDECIVKFHAICPETRYILHTGMLYILSDELRAIGMTDADVLLKPVHDLSKLVQKIMKSVLSRRMV